MELRIKILYIYKVCLPLMFCLEEVTKVLPCPCISFSVQVRGLAINWHSMDKVEGCTVQGPPGGSSGS
jgi:hypothetical protein